MPNFNIKKIERNTICSQSVWSSSGCDVKQSDSLINEPNIVQNLQSNFKGKLMISKQSTSNKKQGIQSIKDIITYFEGNNSSISYSSNHSQDEEKLRVIHEQITRIKDRKKSKTD